jgi:hypothetical protein
VDKERAMPAIVPVIVAASQLMLAADDFPQLNVEPSCRSAATTGSNLPGRNSDACMRDEMQARDKLKNEWNTYDSTEQQRCLRMSHQGGQPSYVELLTCLEVAKAAKSLPDKDPLAPIDR